MGSFACKVSLHCYGLVIIAKKFHGFLTLQENKTCAIDTIWFLNYNFESA